MYEGLRPRAQAFSCGFLGLRFGAANAFHLAKGRALPLSICSTAVPDAELKELVQKAMADNPALAALKDDHAALKDDNAALKEKVNLVASELAITKRVVVGVSGELAETQAAVFTLDVKLTKEIGERKRQLSCALSNID